MVNSLIEYKDLTSYITSLQSTVIEKIFDHPTTCLAIFRELPELAKIVVLRLLLLNQEVKQSTVNSWISSNYQEKSTSTFEILSSLGIISDTFSQGGMHAWTLKPTFKKNLFTGIFRTNEEGSAQTQDQIEHIDQQIDNEFVEKLDNYASERWESVLKYIVNPKDTQNQVCNSTKDVLKYSGLMKSSNDRDSDTQTESNVSLTAAAFQFLLWNRRIQVWHFVIKLLEYCWKKNDQDISECLTLLFEISFSTFGKDYSCENYSPSKLEFLQELRKIGLVFMKTRKIKRYYPTKLAIQLANGINDLNETNKEDKGFIVVETNYRIYAYTDSHLQINLLALFTELMYKFPNMVVGAITRESVREAFKQGITSQQIINFLRANAHPQLRTKKPTIPETVSDQINFWYNERNRLKFTKGVLYGQFNSDEDLFKLKNYAKKLDAIVWFNDSKRTLVVKESAHEDIKKFWKSRAS